MRPSRPQLDLSARVGQPIGGPQQAGVTAEAAAKGRDLGPIQAEARAPAGLPWCCGVLADRISLQGQGVAARPRRLQAAAPLPFGTGRDGEVDRRAEFAVGSSAAAGTGTPSRSMPTE